MTFFEIYNNVCRYCNFLAQIFYLNCHPSAIFQKDQLNKSKYVKTNDSIKLQAHFEIKVIH